MENKIITKIEANIETNKHMIKNHVSIIKEITEVIFKALQKGHKLLICGNGGSASDAQHIAAEFVNRFYLNRKPYAAIALTTDTSIITSIANDFSYEEIFSKQIEALGNAGDVLLAISTSGTAKNVLNAVTAAAKKDITTIAFTGKDGGKLSTAVDIAFIAPSNDTPRIQEAHILVAHIMCEFVEQKLVTAEQ